MRKRVIGGMVLLVLAAGVVLGMSGLRDSRPSRTVYSEASVREQRFRLHSSVDYAERTREIGAADVEYPTFEHIVDVSTGVLLGIVTSRTTSLNLPPASSYGAEERFHSPLIYSEANVSVVRWLRNEDGFPSDEITVVTEGGKAPFPLAPEDALAVNVENPGTIVPGEPQFVSYDAGDGELLQGDKVVLFLVREPFDFYSGPVPVVRITGGAAGVFLVGDAEELYTTVYSLPNNTPVHLAVLEALIRNGP